MEGFLILLAVLIPIALLVLIIVLLGRLSTTLGELRQMREQMAVLLRQLSSGAPIRPAERAAPAPPPSASIVPPIVPPRPAPIPAEGVPSLAPPPSPSSPPPRPVEAKRPTPVISAPPVAPPPMRRPPPPRPSFGERHPDLEKFIGEDLINKIGIAVLVIGMGLLLRYAVLKGLIGNTGLTLISLLAGGVLVFLAHRLRKSFHAFSSVLVAGGIAVFYTTISFAFQKFHLIGQGPAFAIMVVITGLAVALTLAYDRKELAVIALLGGFASPFLVNNGEGNFRVLFTYMLILDVGMLVLANFKKWHVIHILSFVLTLLLFGGWAGSDYNELVPRPAMLAFAFATAFFLVFFGMGLRYNLRHRQAFTALDHALLLVNTAAYYAVGLHFLSDLPMRVTGLFTVLLGLFYLAFALYFHRREGIPRSLQLLLIGLVLTFISLAAPVQLEGSHITLFWAAEAVLLLWFAQRTGLKLVERASVLVTLLMVGSLCMDLFAVYGMDASVLPRPLFNKGWVTGTVSAISLACTVVLLRRDDGEAHLLPALPRRVWRLLATVMGIGLFYLVNMLELRVQLGRIWSPAVIDLAQMAFTLLYLLVIEFGTRTAKDEHRSVVALLIALCGTVYIARFYGSSRLALDEQLGGNGMGYFVFHYASLLLLVVLVWRLALLMRAIVQRPSAGWTAYLWLVTVFIVVVASQELDQVMIGMHGADSGLAAARRVGYPILWGVGSFLFMWYGMRQRMRTIRVIALCLFGLALLKILVDLRSASQGGLVATLIVIGVLLLVVSFMYQKLKGLLKEDAVEPHTDAPPQDPVR